MLDQFQVRDLPLREVLLALESTALQHLVPMLQTKEVETVLILDEVGTPRGVVTREAVLRHTTRLAEMRVGLLPALGVVEVSAETSLSEAAVVVARAGVGAIVCRTEPTSDPKVMLRDEMLNITDWEPLIESKTRRESGIHFAPSAPVRETPPVLTAGRAPMVILL